MMAGWYWRIGCIVIGAIIMGGGVVDTILWVRGRESISHYLREHPAWFWYPACLLVVFLLHLATHLFVRS